MIILWIPAGLNSFYINTYAEMFLCPTLVNIANKFSIKEGFEKNLYLILCYQI